MPELPEVETIVRDLSKPLCHKIFAEVIVHDAFVLRQKAGDFIRRLKGQAIVHIYRQGKAVIVSLASGEFLVVQVMMTGQLVMDGKENRHTRVAFILTGGRRLLYNDQRRFGQLRVVKRLDEVGYLNVLGPEPFADEFSADYMRENFLKSSRPIKNMLLDHTFVAGIGNIYACEMLFKSGIDPRRPACRITKEKIGILHQIISEVLQEAILHRGSSLRNYRDGMGRKGSFTQRLAVYGREGCPCLRCGDPVRRIIQAGRSTFYCGHCQK